MAKGEKFLHKLNFKYKLTILNENTLEEAWHIRLSRLSVFLFCFAIAVIYFFFIALLIIKTPLRTFMPGYTDMNLMRKQVMVQSLQLDSVMEAAATNEKYLDMLRRVVTGHMELTDSSTTLSALVAVDFEKANVEQSNKERQFCAQYEIDQRYAANMTRDMDNKYSLMQKPSFGIVTKGFDPGVGRLGVSITVKPGNSVHCAMDGVVVFSGYSAHNRYCMQIQHADNFVTTYKFNQPFLKHIGEHIKGGEILATLRNQDEASEVTFEIWNNGRPINPQRYITFNTGQQPSELNANSQKERRARQKASEEAPAQQQIQPMPVQQIKVEPTKPMPVQQQPQTQQAAQPKTETEAQKPAQEKEAAHTQEAAPAPAPVPAPAPTQTAEPAQANPNTQAE